MEVDEARTMAVRPAASSRVRTRAWRLTATASHALAGPTSRWRALPDFVIAGAQRAGTTSLYRYLSSHPAVVPPRFIKGAHYFDLHYGNGLAWYRAHFPTQRHLARTSRAIGYPALTGEASPYYMFHPGIPARLAADVPGVKAIIVLRDPVLRAWSQYQHEFARGFETLSFPDALECETARLQGEEQRVLSDSAYVSFSHIHHSYVGRGFYLQQLERLWDHLGRDNVLVIESGQLKRQLQRTFDTVTEFLGLRAFEVERRIVHNARMYDHLPDNLRERLAKTFEEANRQLFDTLAVDWDWTRPSQHVPTG